MAIGLKRGIVRKLVGRDDVIRYLRANGFKQSDIISMDCTIPAFEENLGWKKYISSVYITREVDKKSQSRGFGFVEFTHYTHALVCVRELNNNKKYNEYVLME